MSSDYLYMAPKEGIWWYDGKHWHGKPMGFRIIYEITQTKTFMLVMVLTLLPPLYHLWTLRDGRPAPANVFHVAAIGGAILLYTLGFSNFFLAENVDGQVLGTAAVGGQHHKQMVLASGQLGQHRSQATAVQPGPVFVVLGAGGEKRAVRE